LSAQLHAVHWFLLWSKITILQRCLGEDNSTVHLAEGMQSQLILKRRLGYT